MSQRQTITLLLLSLCAVYRFGDTLFHHIGRERIRKSQMRRIAAMEGEHLFEKVADCEDIQWIEEGREFMMHGRMYDVVQTREKDGAREYLVAPDYRETELMDRFLSWTEGTQGSQGIRMPLPNHFYSFWMPFDINEASRGFHGIKTEPTCFTATLAPEHPFLPVYVPPPDS